MSDEKREKKSIIFVCTGNTCRSPMAEFMFKDYLKSKKRSGEFSVSSAGLAAVRGDVIAQNAVAALELLGIKHNPTRKARVFTVQMSLDADLIIAMSDAAADRCDSNNATSFESLIGRPIPDPYGGSLNDYLDCAAVMRTAFDRILEIADN